MIRLPLLLACGVAILNGAAAAEFVPHRAVYDVTLHSAERGSGILAISGEMLMDSNESCEGWTVRYRFSNEIKVARATPVRVIGNATAWESHDGLAFRFSVRNVTSGEPPERIEGSAQLAGPGKAGTARFDMPTPRTVNLPKGTLFPGAHNDAVFVAAESNKTSMQRYVFDGLEGRGLTVVKTVIGKPVTSPPSRAALKPMAGVKSWPVQFSTYSAGSPNAELIHRIGQRMYANGLTDEMIMDSGQFKLSARLKALEFGTRPNCGPTARR